MNLSQQGRPTSRQRPSWKVGLGIGALAVLLLAAGVMVYGRMQDSTQPTSGGTADQDTVGISANEAKSRGVFAADGDGTVKFVNSRWRAVRGVATPIKVRIRNAGKVRATYTVELTSATPAFDQRTATITLDGGADGTALVQVDSSKLKPGVYTVTANLSSNLLEVDPLSTDSASIELTQ